MDNIKDMQVHSNNIVTRLSTLINHLDNQKVCFKIINEISAAADSLIELCDEALLELK